MTKPGGQEWPSKKGADAAPDLDRHQGSATDPTGHVSSGLQPGPLHGGDERPVASTDEAMRRERLAGSGDAEETQRPRDILKAYPKRDGDEEPDRGSSFD